MDNIKRVEVCQSSLDKLAVYRYLDVIKQTIFELETEQYQQERIVLINVIDDSVNELKVIFDTKLKGIFDAKEIGVINDISNSVNELKVNESFKIIGRHPETKRQQKKRVYTSKEDYLKYKDDLTKRYNYHWDVEHYQLTNNEWELIYDEYYKALDVIIKNNE